MSLIFGAITFLGSLVIAMGAYANQDQGMAGPIAAFMGLGIIIGLVCILIGWALRASDKPQPPVIINQYNQDRMMESRYAPSQPRQASKIPVTVIGAPEQSVSYCQGCGRQAVPGAAFCEGCGRRLN